MTNISPETEATREAHRQSSGEFGAHERSAPGVALPSAPLVLGIACQVSVGRIDVVPYPDDIPPGGKVSLDTDDVSGRVFASIEWEDSGRHLSAGLTDDDDTWTSEADDEPDEETERINDYLISLSRAGDSVAEAVRYAAQNEVMDTITAAVTGVAQRPEEQLTAAHRGARLAEVNGKPDADHSQRAADAVADLLEYARAQGLNPDDIIDQARGYLDD